MSDSVLDGRKFVIFTVGIGAGHDGAAAQWAERLAEHGFGVSTVDLLDLLPRPLARMLRDGYHTTLERRPWLWSATFGLTSRSEVSSLAGWFAGRYRHKVRQMIPAGTVAVPPPGGHLGPPSDRRLPPSSFLLAGQGRVGLVPRFEAGHLGIPESSGGDRAVRPGGVPAS